MADPGSDKSKDASDINQSDIDALLEAAGMADPAGESAPAGDEGLSQADIDAALQAAGEAAPAPAAPETRVDSEGRPFDAAAAAMAAAIAEERTAADADANVSLQNVELPDFGADEGAATTALQSIDLLNDVRLRVRIELGRTRMYVEDVLRLGEGSVVELDKLAGDPVDVFVNDRLVARGEVLVLNDNFCVRVSEIIADENERIAY